MWQELRRRALNRGCVQLHLTAPQLKLPHTILTTSTRLQARPASPGIRACARGYSSRAIRDSFAAEGTQVTAYANSMSALEHSFNSFDPESNDYRALFVSDTGVVQRQHARWVRNLPNVRPYYAVKCNPDQVILRELASNGAGFDCATSAEIRAVLATGTAPEDIIFANPIKSLSDIAFAKAQGIRKMTFDNVSEMRKIHSIFPEAELVLRLLPDDSGSLMRFGAKFGASFEATHELLQTAKTLDLNVIGVSFHIGSGCFEPTKYDDAILLARSVFDKAAELGLPAMHLLDIGGGFPGDPTPHATGRDGVPAFEQFAAVISKAIGRHFPSAEFPKLSCISEPGRYFATASGTLFTMIQGKRSEPEADKALYYINDGVYGSFNSIVFDHAKPEAVPVDAFFADKAEEKQWATSYSAPSEPKKMFSMASHSMSTSAVPNLSSTIFGPTCDSMDKIVDGQMIRELHVGEWLVFDRMGAYTTAAGSEFNGCPRPVTKHVFSCFE